MVAVQRSNTFLSKTFSSDGNKKVFTVSFWAKFPGVYTNEQADGQSQLNRGNTYQQYRPTIFSAKNASNVSTLIEIYSHRDTLSSLGDGQIGTMRFGLNTPDGFNAGNQRIMNPRFQDPSGWYHFVWGIDTTQSTESERVILHVNGIQMHGNPSDMFSTSTAGSYPYQYTGTITQNLEYSFGADVEHFIGRSTQDTDRFFDGMLAHFIFIDGTRYNYTSFAEFDSVTGFYKPKPNPSVTYGTNGFWLKFDDSSNMGADSSGNSNNWTVNGPLVNSKDAPSNCFSSLMRIPRRTTTIGPNYCLVSQSGLDYMAANTSHDTIACSTLGANSGKWYSEYKVVDEGDFVRVGVVQLSTHTNFFIGNANSVLYDSGGQKFVHSGNTGASYGSSYTDGDIVQIALDCDNKAVYFGKNNTWQNSATASEIAAGTTTNAAYVGLNQNDFWQFVITGKNLTNVKANYGQGHFANTALSSAVTESESGGKFEYAPPTGFVGLCTKTINKFG